MPKEKYLPLTEEALDRILGELVIAKIASGDPLFRMLDVKNAVRSAGYSFPSRVTPLRDQIDRRFEPQDQMQPIKGGTRPWDAGKPIRPEEPDTTIGLVDDIKKLEGESATLIDASYRPGGIKHGGISPKPPGKL